MASKKEAHMSLEIVPFTEEHLEDAARLLATRHLQDRKHEPNLPERFEDYGVTLQLLRRVSGQGPGVVALDGGKTVGYLISRPGDEAGAGGFSSTRAAI